MLLIMSVRNCLLKIFNDSSATFQRNVSESCKRSQPAIDPTVLKNLEEGYAKLASSKSKSLLKKHLTKDRFDKLKHLFTPTYNSTLLDCIQSGLLNHDSGIGIYAPDPEAYTTFADIFDPIIEEYHVNFTKDSIQPETNFGNPKDFVNLDPDNKYIVSTRVRCGRSVSSYPFNPCMSEYDYNDLEDCIERTLQCLTGELSGHYTSLCEMDCCTQEKLVDDHLLFKKGDRFLRSAKALRFWPKGRGIFLNKKINFIVWCNEEDHLRIISMDKGGDLGKVYKRMVDGVEAIGNTLTFARDKRLGYLTFCPTNLGTTIRASVHIKLPKLAASKDALEQIATKYRLQVRGTRGEHTAAEGGVYDISNKQRMGLTECEAVMTMQDGILELIKAEKNAK